MEAQSVLPKVGTSVGCLTVNLFTQNTTQVHLWKVCKRGGAHGGGGVRRNTTSYSKNSLNGGSRGPAGQNRADRRVLRAECNPQPFSPVFDVEHFLFLRTEEQR